MDDNFSLASQISKEEECDRALVMMYSALMALVDKLKNIPELSQYSNFDSQISEISKLGSASFGSMAPQKKKEFYEYIEKILKRLMQIRDDMLKHRVVESELGSTRSIGTSKASSYMPGFSQMGLTNKLSLASKLSLLSQKLNQSLVDFYQAVKGLAEKMKKNENFIDAMSVHSEMLSTISSKMSMTGDLVTAFTRGSYKSVLDKNQMNNFYQAMIALEKEMRLKGVNWDAESVMSDLSVISSKMSQKSNLSNKMSLFSEYSIRTFSDLRKKKLGNIMDIFYGAINELMKMMKQKEEVLSMMSKMTDEVNSIQDKKMISSLKGQDSDIADEDLMKQYRTQEHPFKKSKTKDLMLDMQLIEDNKSVPGHPQSFSTKARRKIDFGAGDGIRSIGTKRLKNREDDTSMIGSRSNLSSQEPSISLASTPNYFENFKDDLNQRIKESNQKMREKEKELLKKITIEDGKSDCGNSVNTILVNMEEIKNDETKRLILKDSKQNLKIDVSELLSTIPKNYHDGDFKPNIYSLLADIKDDDERNRLKFEWRRLKYIFKGENVRIWGKPKNIKLDSKYNLNSNLMSLLNGLFFKKYDISDIFNLERCRQEKGKHEIFLYNRKTKGRDILVFDDFVPVEMKGENSIVSKHTGKRSLFEGEPKFELAYLRPVYSGNGIISIFPSLIEKGLAKFYNSYEKMFKVPIEELAYTLTRSLSFSLGLKSENDMKKIREYESERNFYIFFEIEKTGNYLSLEKISKDKNSFTLTSHRYQSSLSEFNIDNTRISYEIEESKLNQYFKRAIVLWVNSEYIYNSIEIESGRSELINLSVNSETEIVIGLKYFENQSNKNFSLKVFGVDEEANKYIIENEIESRKGRNGFLKRRLKPGYYMVQIEQMNNEKDIQSVKGSLELYSDKRVIANSVKDPQLNRKLRSDLFKTSFIEGNPQRAEINSLKRHGMFIEYIQYSDSFKLYRFTKVSNDKSTEVVDIENYDKLKQEEKFKVVSNLPKNSFDSGQITLTQTLALKETLGQMVQDDEMQEATYILTYSKSQDTVLSFI